MKNYKSKKYIAMHLAILMGLVISISMYSFRSGCENIKENVLRLHIIANSDSEFDQNLKLKVRDELLNCSKELFGGETNKLTAEKIALEENAYLIERAKQIINENGKDYDVRISVCEDYFPTRTYENVTLPAGNYTAVKVIIGEGKGHNWWCVMFPPMCLPAATGNTEIEDVLDENGMKVVSSSPKYEVKFKIVEWYEWAKNKILNR